MKIQSLPSSIVSLPAAKRARPTLASNAYRTVHTVPEPGGFEKEFHMFGVVIGYQLPQPTRGPDFKSVLYLVDESSQNGSDHVAINFFKAHPEVPGVGSVIRLHRLEPKARWDGVRQAQGVSRGSGKKLSTHWVVGDSALATHPDAGGDGLLLADADVRRGNFSWCREDLARMRELGEWSRAALSHVGGPFSTFRYKSHSLVEANASAWPQPFNGRPPLPADMKEVDLLVQLGPPLAEAAASAAAPSAHGLGGTGALLAIAQLRDVGERACAHTGGAPTAGAPAADASSARLYLAHTVPPMTAQVLLRMFTLPRSNAKGAAASGILSTYTFSERWVRLRSVRLGWSVNAEQTPSLRVIFDNKSMAMRIPNHHAQVQLLHGSHDGWQEYASSASSASSMPMRPQPPLPLPPLGNSNNPGLLLLPPGSRGEDSARGTHMGGDVVRLAAAHEPTSNELPGDAEVISLRSARQLDGAEVLAVSGLRTHTRMLLPCTSPAISIRQIQDQETEVPCVHRVCATVLQAFPRDEREWTVKRPGASTYSYAMVLQLADTRNQTTSATLSAALLGREGERFFSGLGLPPTNLRKGNVTLAALRARMSTLCASAPMELLLLAYRPCREDSSYAGVAYRIVGTLCLPGY